MKTGLTPSTLNSQLSTLNFPFRLRNNICGHSVEPGRGAHVKTGDDPGHEKLRKGEEISEIHWTEHLRFHERPRITNQRRQSKVVDDEKDHRWHDEPSLCFEQASESIA